MGGKKKSQGPSAADYKKQAKNYWQNYSRWTKEEQDRYERDVASASARFAASGMKIGGPGNEMVEKYMASRKASYDEAMKQLETGEHGSFLKDYYDDYVKTQRAEIKPFSGFEMDRNNYYRPSYRSKYGHKNKNANDTIDMYHHRDEIMQRLVNAESLGILERRRVMNQLNQDLDNINEKINEKTKQTDKNIMSFEDFYKKQFNEASLEGPSKEEEALERAKKAGSGRRQAASGVLERQAVSALDENKRAGRSGWWA